MSDTTIRVLYIAGAQRSGSTLLSCLLGQDRHICAAGEIALFWERGFAENQLCGCGKSVRACEFWREVVERVFGGWQGADLREFSRLRLSTSRFRHFPVLVWRGLRSAGFQRQFDSWSAMLSAFYTGIQEVSRKPVIVDSSKSPVYGILLSQIPRVDLRVIHLIRDSRAVAFSMQRKVYRRTVDALEPSPTLNAPYAASYWVAAHLMTEHLKRKTQSSFSVHYESLVSRPEETLGKIAEYAGIPAFDLSYFQQPAIPRLNANHIPVGNRNRFIHGLTPIHLDVEWQTRMPMISCGIVTAITWPMLLRYHYRLFSKKKER